ARAAALGEASEPIPTSERSRLQVAAPVARLAAVYRGVRASLLATGGPARAYLAHFDADGGGADFRFGRAPERAALAGAPAGAAGGRPAAELATDQSLVQALRALKQRLDPDGILSGGRLL